MQGPQVVRGGRNPSSQRHALLQAIGMLSVDLDLCSYSCRRTLARDASITEEVVYSMRFGVELVGMVKC